MGGMYHLSSFRAHFGELGHVRNEILTALMIIGAAVGAAVGGFIMEKFGRKRSGQAAGAAITLGSVLLVASVSWVMLGIGRFIAGLGVGIESVVIPVYVAEIAPARLRGSVVTLHQLFITVGILVAYSVDLAFDKVNNGWQWVLGLTMIPAIALLIGMLLLPETPRWLAQKGRTEEAHQVLQKLSPADGQQAETDAAEILVEIEGVLKDPLRLKDSCAPHVRPLFIVGVGLMLFQQLVGVNIFVYYIPFMFYSITEARTDALLMAIVMGSVNVVMTVPALFLVDKFGRRRLLLAGAAAMCVVWCACTFTFIGFIEAGNSDQAWWCLVLFASVYMAAFAISWGPVPWVIAAEVFPLKLRSFGMSLALIGNWCANTLITMTGLSFAKACFPFHMFLYAFCCLMAFTFVYLFLPETQGVVLERMEAVFAQASRLLCCKCCRSSAESQPLIFRAVRRDPSTPVSVTVTAVHTALVTPGSPASPHIQ
eukprot:TRINITY_DN2366_c0_g1_i3.p1 TRINITY_DN2366_c0_g1~~TRINITY_DN2366_c0_g1_i3.p1  ORF type:complete len:482 (-),score=108.48 TRINITY_DN2366_c0_g1_i3:1101-2546(-)